MWRHDDNIGRWISDFQHDARFFHLSRWHIEISHAIRWRWWWRRRRMMMQHRFAITTISVFIIIDDGARWRYINGMCHTIAAWITPAWRQMCRVERLHWCIHWIRQRCRCISRWMVAECGKFVCVRRWLGTRWSRRWRRRRIFATNSARIQWITAKMLIHA